MNSKLLATAIVFAALAVGCDSKPSYEPSSAVVEQTADVQATAAREQWELDQLFAPEVFQGHTDNFLTWRKCHSEPPTKEANQRVCAVLQKRVSDAEKKFKAQQAKVKASW